MPPERPSCACADSDLNRSRLIAGLVLVHHRTVHHDSSNCPGEHVGRKFCPYCGSGWQ